MIAAITTNNTEILIHDLLYTLYTGQQCDPNASILYLNLMLQLTFAYISIQASQNIHTNLSNW